LNLAWCRGSKNGGGGNEREKEKDPWGEDRVVEEDVLGVKTIKKSNVLSNILKKRRKRRKGISESKNRQKLIRIFRELGNRRKFLGGGLGF